ncbi:ABC transporter permease [Geminicoccaceae bacterium 1502E]|nr:ABC transporter permease [Geminicoccaceae bacterium 1502E]
MTTARRADDGSWLILPALALLLIAFVGPLIWFFAQALATEENLLDRAVAVLTSKAVATTIVTTNWISLLVTLLVLLIGYPIAYYLANRNGLRFAAVLFCIIVPYFTSVIVRTYSWMVLLGRDGLVNQGLMAVGLTDAPVPLLYNKTGVLIGMVYVLLPYMILTIFASMKSIDPRLVQAARSLGAGSAYTFFRVYFPLSFHGVVSGSLIVFILSIGFFITPALMGGPSDVMIAMLIERAVEITFDWTSAAIMSLLLLIITLLLYAVYYRVTDVRRMMGG